VRCVLRSLPPQMFCAASWGDGVVPLYSALMTHIHAPPPPPPSPPAINTSASSTKAGAVPLQPTPPPPATGGVLRAVFVDQPLAKDTPEFVLNLIALALHAVNAHSNHSHSQSSVSAAAAVAALDVLAHASGFVRGSLLNRSATHSTIHSNLDAYKYVVQ
jgi:hypothetical protein